ncbi:MAG TPA: SDR family NAD(P)-dependent oxidoreductase, partial [Ktedonobacteraceae bacterium]|nr:SDR family NAD(P)-dependent oxidoreductase [Ktedonobacteraceae bacterium]
QTFCSTSLVAVHLACQSLLHGECDLALAGGVSVRVPAIAGHLYQEGGMESPDGHCRTFDAQARGSLFGDGVGVVVLKRLSEALADGDPIRAVIKGSAINNDGSLKVSYTAPSVVGQAEVVSTALQVAGVSAESISYLEAHGTATELGDPIEVASLTKAFSTQTDQTGFCAIGSVKTNIGHLDRAAGVSGLIKTVLSLEHAQIPASLHFQSPNPEIDFVHGPFYVNTTLAPWKRNGTPRRAGINSLGMGGTNVHVIVEEAPTRAASGPSRPWQLLLLSAKTSTTLEAVTRNVCDYLQQHEASALADVAYSLQVGRSRFEQRRMLVCHSREEAIDLLATIPGNAVVSHVEQRTDRPVAFLFSGVGEQYPGMTQELYEQEPVFREVVDHCAALLKPLLGLDIREVISIKQEDSHAHSNGNGKSQSGLDLRALLGRNGHNGNGTIAPIERLKQTQYAQPLMFVIEYALAQLLMQWGIRPQAMIGYSLGEYVAACLSGVLSLEDALLLVARRAQLIQAQPVGAMLAVALSEQAIQPYLTEQVCLAIINAPTTCVLAGPREAIGQVEQQLNAQGIAARRVETTHAFHSSMLTPLQEALTEVVQHVSLHAPQIPYLSNVTGTWITIEQATNPGYWAQHMCQTVRFAEGISHILQQNEPVLIEIGVGSALGSFVKQQVVSSSSERMPLVVSTLPAVYERHSEQAFLLTTLGKLWLAGVTIDWQGFYAHEQRQRLALPTYPFERQRYWIEPKKRVRTVSGRLATAGNEPERIADSSNWFSLPVWKQSASQHLFEASKLAENRLCWMIFVDECGMGQQIIDQLLQYDQQIVSVMSGSTFSSPGQNTYIVNPGKRADYDALFKEVRKQGKMPNRIVHLWTTTAHTSSAADANTLQDSLDRGFYSLLALVQAAEDQGIGTCEISVISNNMQDVTGNEQLCPEKATIIGPCKVISQEYPQLRSRSIDITLAQPGTRQAELLSRQLLGELTGEPADTFVALRGNRRWIQGFEPVQIADQVVQTSRLREGGVYLITGGLGGIGLAIAEFLARTLKPKLILMGRSGLPSCQQWPQLLIERGEIDKIGRQIRKVQMLEELGAEVLVMQADVANEPQMQTVVQQAVHAFGTIHGVFHTAGVPGAGLIQHKTLQMAASVLSPKVMGTLVLERVLQNIPLDFLVLFSSITSAIGGPGQVDYCAANAFLDAYAHQRFNLDGSTVAINWSEWQWNAWESGMAGLGEAVQSYFKENRRKYGLAFEEGIEALLRILSQPLPQVVVSTQDFHAVVEMNSSLTATAVLQRAQQAQPAKAIHARPALGISYVAPRNELEQRVASVWEALLGIAQVGIHDNFFELGGNSLIGLNLITRMKQELNIQVLPAYVLYEAPSVAAMTHYLEQEQDEREKPDLAIEEWHERSEKRREHLKQRIRGTRRTG